MKVDDDGIWRCRNVELDREDCSLIGLALSMVGMDARARDSKWMLSTAQAASYSRRCSELGKLFRCAQRGVLYDIGDDNAEA